MILVYFPARWLKGMEPPVVAHHRGGFARANVHSRKAKKLLLMTQRRRRMSTYKTHNVDYYGNVLLGYERDLGKLLILRANLDAIFSDEYHPSPNLDDRVKQDAFVQFNGRISVSSNDGVWEVALLGKNRTDELIILYAIDTPIANKVIAGTTTHHGFTNPPRTFALQASYRW